MQDTLALAREVKLSQGSHECQVTCGGEGDLYQDYKSCTKNPDHTDFIPVDEFTIGRLPPEYQDNALFKCIPALSNITVRLTVDVISSNRPGLESATSTPYPFAKCKESSCMRVGSGWLRKVKHFTTLQNGACSCGSCSHSESPNTEGAELIVRTAAHVVYDGEEGKHATCCFFYDENVPLESCRTKVTFSGAIRVVTDVNGDWCDMTFVTHDKYQAEMFSSLLDDYYKLHQEVWDNYPPDNTAKSRPSGDELNLAIIVSHPHGCCKKISIGRFQRRHEVTKYNQFTQYTYTTATCPGSSGAPVFILGRSRRWPWCSHPHSGNCEDVKSLNYSGLGRN